MKALTPTSCLRVVKQKTCVKSDTLWERQHTPVNWNFDTFMHNGKTRQNQRLVARDSLWNG